MVLRVALLGDYPLEADKIQGGVQAVFAYLTKGLGRLPDLEVFAVTLVDGLKQPFQDRRDNVSVWFLPSQGHLKALTLFYFDRKRVLDALREIKPDLVHSQGMGESAYIALTSSYPALVSIHGLTKRDAMAKATLWHLIRAQINTSIPEGHFRRRVRHAIASSPYVRRSYEGKLPQATIYDVLNPIDETFFALKDDERKGQLFFAGRIVARKRLEVLLKALQLVVVKCPFARLNIIGPAPDMAYQTYLKRLISEYELNSYVNFTGLIPQDELLSQLAQSSIVLLSSQEETSPMLIQQAMAAGKSVVSTAAGGVPDLVRDGKTGYVVPVGDAAVMADRIVELLTDDGLRCTFGIAAKQVALDEFHIDAVTKQHLGVYKKVLASYNK